MNRFLWSIVGLIIVAMFVMVIIEPSMFSMGEYECFGWSSCDDDVEQHCASPDEYVNSYMISSHCQQYAICVSEYQIVCEDFDDNNIFYYRYVRCESSNQWNCYHN